MKAYWLLVAGGCLAAHLSAALAAPEPAIPRTWLEFKESKSPADKRVVAMVARLQFYNACIAWGRAARADKDERLKLGLLTYLQSQNGVNGIDLGNVRSARPAIGMTLCGVAAVMGRPDRVNQTQTPSGHHSQLVYQAKRTFVYLDGPDANGLVSAVQF